MNLMILRLGSKNTSMFVNPFIASHEETNVRKILFSLKVEEEIGHHGATIFFFFT